MMLPLLTEFDFTALGEWGPAAKVIVAGVTSVGTILVPFIVRDIRKLGWSAFKDKWITRSAARRRTLDELVTVCARLENDIKGIAAELKTNGGRSLKDTVDRIHRKVEYNQGKQRYQEEMSGVATFDLDERGSMTYASSKLCCVLDVDEKELLHRNFISRVRSADRGILIKDLYDAIENKMPLDTTVIFNKGLTTIQLHITASPFVRPGGELTGFFGRAEIV